jgi:hypothetical protein
MIARAASSFALLATLAMPGCSPDDALTSGAQAPPPAQVARSGQGQARAPVLHNPVADTRAEMRQRLLTGSAADFHVVLPQGRNVWGVVMEMGYPNGATVSVIALADGHSSISLSTAPDVITTADRDAVRKAAVRVTTTAEDAAPHLEKTIRFPPPKLDEVTFYLLTRDGVRSETATQEELAGGAHPLSPLFMAAQDVITVSR